MAEEKKTIEGAAETKPENRSAWHGLKNLTKKVLFKNQDTLKESLEELIEEREGEGERIDPEEKQMITNVLAFGDLRVDQVMTPRAYIDAVDQGITLERLEKFIAEKQHTRIPVYSRTLDDVKGFIHVKDLFPYLGGEKEFILKEILRPILFIVPATHIIDLLAKMRASRVHIALVIDEYGGTAGLITMEDLMEKIVGEIRDEHDVSEKDYDFSQVGSFAFEVSAAMPVRLLEEKLRSNIASDEEKEDFDTIGGMIFTLLGRVPAKGEMIQHPNGLVFEIIEGDRRKIKKVLIRNNIPGKNLAG